MQQVCYSQATEIRKGMGLSGWSLITIWGSWWDSHIQFMQQTPLLAPLQSLHLKLMWE